MGVFSPEGSVSLSINGSNTTTPLPAGNGNVLRLVNTGIAGAVAVHAKLGGSGVAATTAEPAVAPNGEANELLLDIAVGAHTHFGLIGVGAGPTTIIATRGFYRG